MTFEQWWKTEGQFVPPLDQLSNGFVLDHYKQFAEAVWSGRDSEIEELENRMIDLEEGTI